MTILRCTAAAIQARPNTIRLSLVILALLSCTIAYANADTVRPNILILLTDDQRPDTLTCYDSASPIRTPEIDRLASLGTLFRHAFVTTPICCVSRASILTGRYAANHRVHNFNVPLDDEIFADSYPAHLKRSGYFTGALGKHGVGITAQVRESYDVFDAQATQGPRFRNYLGKRMHDAEWLTVRTLEFLDQVPAGQAFCLQVNYKEPHGTSVPAPEDDNLLESKFFQRGATDTEAAFKMNPLRVQQGLNRWCYINEYNKDGNINPYIRQYHEKIVSVDRSVGAILEGLSSRGLAGNTVVLFLSDHGLHLGEKQLSGKWTPYEQSLRIPFIYYDPRNQERRGLENQQMVLNIDLAPTVLELAGLAVPASMDGLSLLPLVQGQSNSWRDIFYIEHYCSPPTAPWFIPRHEGYRTEKEKFIRWVDMGHVVEEYFDLQTDTEEINNLAGVASAEDRVEAARSRFKEWRKLNPVNYEHKLGGVPHFDSRDIDWARFETEKPKEFARIKAQVERLGVTWQQAVEDWEIRYTIGKNARYWY